MKYCTRCGRPNDDRAKFCTACGAAFSEMEKVTAPQPTDMNQAQTPSAPQGSEETVLLHNNVPPVNASGDEGTVLLNNVPPVNASGDEGTVLLNNVPPVNASGDEGTVLLDNVPPVNASGDEGTVLLDNVPPVNASGDEGTVLLDNVPPVNASGDEGTVLLDNVPPVNASGDEGTVPMNQPNEPAFIPPVQQPYEQNPAYMQPPMANAPQEAGAAPPVPPFIPPQNDGSTFVPPENNLPPKDPNRKKRGKLITLLCVIGVVVIGAIVGIVIWLSTNPFESPAAEALALGDKYLEELDYAHAVASFTKATEIDPNNKDAYLGLAQAYNGLEEYAQAEATYQQLLELDEKNTVAYRELAELYLRQQKLTEAKELLEKASGLVDDESIRALYEETSPEAPTFSVAPGAYDTRQAVSLVPAKEGHIIHYTLDGTTPTIDSLVYNEPIILRNGQTTIKAIAVSSYGFESEETTGAYTINLESQVVTFEDPNIEYAVRNVLNKYFGDLYDDEVAQITSLCIVGDTVMDSSDAVVFVEDGYQYWGSSWVYSDMGPVKTLNDLQKMPFLKKFCIAYQEGLDITALSSASQLEELSLIHVGVSDLSPIANLTNLKRLCVGSNAVTDLSPVANLTNLRSLAFWNNQVSDISAVSNLKELTYLDFAKNNVSDLSPIKGLEKLSDLWMYQNQVSDFSPLEDVSSLRVLMVRDNPISDKTSLQKVFPRLSRIDVDVIDRGGDTE
ncbi:leucine-rich repeat domain-containing protein [Phocea massiliensis]|uniref:Leucine-rich repeat domain-containing protein n=1 Tax=Merdimmobilis hominis TaxID=2897707 RepID=A0A939BEA5_9FIRM|nr:leucine-rich repeat domain-containing protein [Merdimmobilis hominis]MBM6920413.1 leucine-rich repeat domain-containing protein [Merdimmobilis hominis]